MTQEPTTSYHKDSVRIVGHDGRVKMGNVEMDGTTGWGVMADGLVGWTATRYGRAAVSSCRGQAEMGGQLMHDGCRQLSKEHNKAGVNREEVVASMYSSVRYARCSTRLGRRSVGAADLLQAARER